ncbi:MAG TPA: CHRD domain-containing protein [Vicinamibacterales bacterium]|jgi:hypothetical protein
MVGTNRTIAIATCAVITLAGTLNVRAQAPTRGHADLNGYEETPTISSPASGTLDVQISGDGQSLSYTLTYSRLATNVLFAHIHIGRPAIAGGIMAFLCTNGTPAPEGVPAPPPCPQNSGTVSGMLTAANIMAVTAQGVSVGDFAAFIAALRSEAAYGNVHTDAFKTGEIRGQITFTSTSGNTGNTNGGNNNNQ